MMSDVGCRMSDVGCRMSDVGCFAAQVIKKNSVNSVCPVRQSLFFSFYLLANSITSAQQIFLWNLAQWPGREFLEY